MAEYIDREALVEHLNVLLYGRFTEMPLYMAVIGTINEIKKFPSVDVQPVVHGRWNATHESGLFSHPDSITYVCSECGKQFYTLYSMPPLSNYCPNCGADMREYKQTYKPPINWCGEEPIGEET